MYKKFIISGLFIFFTWSIVAAQQHHVVPYENVIAREYNRLRGGVNHYTSINEIISQTLRGKSSQQKINIITDLRALKYAIQLALAEAESDGKRMWYSAYLWKDNNPTIEILSQYEDDVSEKISEFEFAAQPDYIRALIYSAKILTYITIGMGLSYLSQGYLDKKHYAEHGQHGPIEMFYAPLQGGYDIAKQTGTSTLNAIKYAVKYSNDFLSPSPTTYNKT